MTENTITVLPAVDVDAFAARAEEAGNKGISTFRMAVEAMLARELASDEDYEACLALAVEANNRADRVAEEFNGTCQAFHRAHRLLTGLRARFTDTWKNWGRDLNDKAKRYWLAQQAERERIERQLALQASQEQRAIEREADALMAQGYVQQAQEKASQSRQVPPAPVLPPAVPKVAGTRVRPRWRAECTDILALAKAIVEGKVALCHHVKGEELPLLIINPKVLTALADRMGKSLNLPGVKVEPDVNIMRR